MAEPNIGEIFMNVGNQLSNVSAILGTQSIAQVISTFDGNPKHFKNWMKNIEKYGTLTGLDEEHLKMVAYQSSKLAVSDFIQRFLKIRPERSWQELKEELTNRFAEIRDSQHAFALLRNIKQGHNENLQVFGERILALAEEIITEGQGDIAVLESQLIGFFIDGLNHDYLKMKVMRENPRTLQDAIRSAMNEQNLRTRFNLRMHKPQNTHEPMEVDTYRPVKTCHFCKRRGHVIQECKTRLREINAVQYNTETRQKPRLPFHEWVRDKECWNCGQLGHLQRDCVKNVNRQSRQEN